MIRSKTKEIQSPNSIPLYSLNEKKKPRTVHQKSKSSKNLILDTSLQEKPKEKQEIVCY